MGRGSVLFLGVLPLSSCRADIGSLSLEVGFLFAVCAIETDLEGLCSELSKKCVLFLQFLTFSERLNNINIDIIHRIDRTGSCAEVRAAIVIIF